MRLPYQNRSEAGRALAEALQPYANRLDVLVLALPRGGVPVAYEVAKALGAPLDLMLVGKLGLPGHEELAMGAIATGGIRVLNAEIIQGLAVSEAEIERITAAEWQELQRRERAYRDDRAGPEVHGRCVILIDDGLATGATMQAAVAAIRPQGPAEVVVAIPVAPADTVALLRDQADAVICPATPEPFLGVGWWYEDFAQNTDAEVRHLLRRIWGEQPAREGSAGMTAGAGASRPVSWPSLP
jgi:putative phosphoribosyl transferase